MAFDGLFTYAMTKELSKLTTGRISKIHQPNALEIVMHIRANGANHKLLCSIHPSYARIHLTNTQIENPPEPPLFCMLLRKHIEGGFIQEIKSDPFERIITIKIESKNEIGDTVYRNLIIEIMGRHSNLILTDANTNKIIDSIKHLPPTINRFRTVLPGEIYISPPAQNKLYPLSVSDDEIIHFFSTEKSAKNIIETFKGFSSIHANELLYRLKNSDNYGETFHQYIDEIITIASPTFVEENNKTYFSPARLTHLEGEKTLFNDLSSLLDRVFYARAERDRVKQRAKDLEKWLQNERNKLTLKLKKLEEDIEKASKLDQFQLYGELLMANLYNFQKGMKEVTVSNYYSENGEKISIPLDERKTPIENAQSYYTKYNKAKNALVILKEQIEKTEQEIKYFDMIATQIEQASPSDIEEIREELAEQGYLKLRKSKKKKKDVKPEPEKIYSSTGIPISIGKNNKQNDYLTFKIAKKSDIWMHTKDIPGSHVVIHSNSPDETTLLEAAKLCAYFSKARESSSVPVDYTEIRHVKKPNGAKPGFVIYFEQKTLFVTPDENLLLKLKNNSK